LPHHELNVLRKKDKGAKPIEALWNNLRGLNYAEWKYHLTFSGKTSYFGVIFWQDSNTNYK
jgi:hypothetical protein